MNKELLIDLIRFKTVYGNKEEFNKCFNYIKNYFKDSRLIIKEYEFLEEKSLVISNCNTKSFDILFVGHLDVVSGLEEQFEPFIVENKLYGRGSFDMKGHVSIMMEIMKNLDKFNTKYKIGLFLTSDEERGGFLGVNRLLKDIKYKTKIAIVPDAGNNFNLIEEEKGVLQLELSYRGKTSHASKTWEGDNALSHLINTYQKLLEKYPLPLCEDDYVTSINLSKMNGGSDINKVCDEAYMILDIRHVVNDKKDDIINYIKMIDKKIKIKVLAKGDSFAYYENYLSYKYLEACYEILGKNVKVSKCESSSDGRYFSNLGITTIMMNAKGYDIHGNKEAIDLKSLDKLYAIYRCFLENK